MAFSGGGAPDVYRTAGCMQKISLVYRRVEMGIPADLCSVVGVEYLFTCKTDQQPYPGGSKIYPDDHLLNSKRWSDNGVLLDDGTRAVK